VRRSLRKWASPITLLMLLGLLGWGLWWGWQQLSRPAQVVPAAPCVTHSASVLTSTQVTVQVMNAGTVAGLAGQITEQLRNKGFTTKPPRNTDGPIDNTVVVGATADEPAVQLVLGFFPGAEVRPDGRTDGTVDVLVGDTFGGFNEAAPTEIGVPGGTVCLPESTSTQASPAPQAP